MKLRRFSDPFTAGGFSAVEIDDALIIDNALTGEKMRFEIEDDTIRLPLEMCAPIEIVDAQTAAMTLHISRQRLSQLVTAKVLHPIYLGNTQYFIEEKVLEYKRNRKNGRPRKDTQ